MLYQSNQGDSSALPLSVTLSLPSFIHCRLTLFFRLSVTASLVSSLFPLQVMRMHMLVCVCVCVCVCACPAAHDRWSHYRNGRGLGRTCTLTHKYIFILLRNGHFTHTHTHTHTHTLLWMHLLHAVITNTPTWHQPDSSFSPPPKSQQALTTKCSPPLPHLFSSCSPQPSIHLAH